MMNTKRPPGTNTVEATFQGTTITFFSYANNLIDQYVIAVERFRDIGLEANINNISLSVR